MLSDDHRVNITPEAQADINRILQYITADSPQAAAAVTAKVLQAIDALSYMPMRFRRLGVSRKYRAPVHSTLVNPFIVYYRVDPDQKVVFVFSIRRGRQKQLRRFP